MDAWGVALAAAFGLAVALGGSRRQQLRHWRHHPFRMSVERHLANALLSAAALLAFAGAAHMAGFPVYDVPLLGVAALVVLMVVVVGGVLAWRSHFLPLLVRYDALHQHEAVRDARLPAAKEWAEAPY